MPPLFFIIHTIRRQRQKHLAHSMQSPAKRVCKLLLTPLMPARLSLKITALFYKVGMQKIHQYHRQRQQREKH